MVKSVEKRKKELEKFFGILSEQEAEELWREIKEHRKKWNERLERLINDCR
jgi:predicted CopG family antitoxin